MSPTRQRSPRGARPALDETCQGHKGIVAALIEKRGSSRSDPPLRPGRLRAGDVAEGTRSTRLGNPASETPSTCLRDPREYLQPRVIRPLPDQRGQSQELENNMTR